MGMSRYPISVPCRLQSLDPTLFGNQTGRVYVGLVPREVKRFLLISTGGLMFRVFGPPAKIRQRSATFSHLY